MWKKSEVWKNRKFQLLLLAELALLCVGLAGVLAGRHTVSTLESMVIETTGGSSQGDKNVYAVDSRDGVQGQWLTARGFSLTPGSYELTLYYEATDPAGSSVEILADNTSFGALQANSVYLYGGISSRSFQFYVTDWLGPEENLRVSVEYAGAEELKLTGMELMRTTAADRAFVVTVLGLSLLLDTLVMLWLYLGKYPVELVQKLVWFGIPAFALLASLPLAVDYIIPGPDSIYHILRIEFLADGLSKGILPVRVAPQWIYGHGYASSLFYCDTFLLLPAVLRLIGFSMTAAYGLFVLGVNLATAAIAYRAFRGMFQSKYIGLFGSLLYTLAPYRIYNIYNRSAVGEFVAMTFLPLVCYGFYLLLGEDTGKKEYRNHWVVLMLGMSGILQSHVLSAEIVTGFAALACLLAIKRVLRRATLIQLAKAVGGTVLLNLWFLLPFLDMMASGQYKYSQNQGVHIQARGILPAHIFYTLQNAGGNSRFHEKGMLDTEPIGVGIALLTGTIVFLALRKKCRQQEPGTYRVSVLALVLGGAATVMSLAYFPWDTIQTWNRIAGTLIPMIQFPTRLTMIPSVCLVMVSCGAGLWIVRHGQKSAKIAFFGAVAACSLFFSMYQTNDILDTRTGVFRPYTMENAGNSSVLGAEYLPLEADLCLEYHGPQTFGGVIVSSYEKVDLDVLTEVSVAEDAGESWLELPMYYYKGYRAQDAQTGAELPVESGENAHVRVLLEPGYEGTVHVWYAGMWYWRAAEAVSLLFAVGLCGGAVRKRRLSLTETAT